VHNDYTVRSGYTRAQQLLAPYVDSVDIKQALSGRFAIINVWRPITPVERDPIAFLPWDTVKPEDVQTVQLIYTHRIGETYRVFHSDRHRWVYWSHMQPNEVVMFKTFDSADDGRARHALHSAVEIGEPNAAARQSIEVRTLCFFDQNSCDFAPQFRAPHLSPSPDSDARESLKERKYLEMPPGHW